MSANADGSINAYSDGETMYVLSNSDITFPYDVSGLFKNWKVLEGVQFNAVDSSKVTNMNQIFLGCSALKSIDLTPLDLSAVTGMSGAFQDCKAMVTARVGNIPSGDNLSYMPVCTV